MAYGFVAIMVLLTGFYWFIMIFSTELRDTFQVGRQEIDAAWNHLLLSRTSRSSPRPSCTAPSPSGFSMSSSEALRTNIIIYYNNQNVIKLDGVGPVDNRPSTD